MSRITEIIKHGLSAGHLYLLCIFFLLSACTTAPPEKPAKPAPPVKPVVVKPAPVLSVPKKVEVVQPAASIVLSGNVSLYRDVATELNKKLGDDTKIYTLTGNRQKDAAIIAQLQSADTQQLVAVGVRAAQALANMQDRQVVFSHVFNYQKLHLVKDNMKGISALPGARQLFQDWKAISPDTKKVAVLSGPGIDAYIANATAEAAKNNIKLMHFVVKTDKEFLYRTKKLPLDVQGQWIVPDNRVLSRKVLKEVLTYNAKEGKQTVVFSPKLLALGGLFYSRVSTTEIAEKIYQRLLEAAGQDTVPGAGVVLLADHEMGINPVVARQLGLNIPAAYKKYLHD